MDFKTFLKKALDTPYVYGGGHVSFGPHAVAASNGIVGLDCSGLVSWWLGESGVISAPMGARALADLYTVIPREAATADGACAAWYGTRAGDVSSLCHIVLVVGYKDGVLFTLGANSGGSSTFGQDSNARVKLGQNYWRSNELFVGRLKNA